jgi:hypothetical protein
MKTMPSHGTGFPAASRLGQKEARARDLTLSNRLNATVDSTKKNHFSLKRVDMHRDNVSSQIARLQQPPLAVDAEC